MSIRRYFSDGLRIFADTRFIAVYICYTVLIALISGYVYPVRILALIFVEPLFLSYAAGRYFIDAVDPARLSEHRRMRFKFYIPFMKIFGSILLLILIIQAVFSRIDHQWSNTPVPMLALLSLISATVAFWMAGTIFSRGGLWKGLQKAVALLRRNLPLYVLFFSIYCIFEILQEFYGFGNFKGGAVMPFVIIHFVYAVFDLYIIRVTMLLAAASQDISVSKAALNDYINPVPEERGRGSETGQIKKANTCLLLGVLSVIPVVHLFALVLGWRLFNRQDSGRFRSMVGLILGGFFTIMYSIALMGSLLTHQRVQPRLEHPAGNVSHAFMQDDQSPEVLFHTGRIALFDKHDYFEARNSLVKFLTYSPGDKTARRYISLIDNRVEWDNNWVISLFSVIALLIAITSHEFGHSYTAYKCGDMTSKDAGRMSLNPFVHLDLFGSVILPAFLILSRSGIIVGWAKPVPVNRENFKNPQRDSTLVSVMGCFTNFSIALAATVLLALVTLILAIAAPDFISLNWFYPADIISVAGLPFAKFWIYCSIFLSLIIVINIAIGIFNLIPIPPLDGAWMAERRLAHLLKEKYAVYQQFSFLLILILLFTGVIDVIIGSVLNAYFMCTRILIVSALGLT